MSNKINTVNEYMITFPFKGVYMIVTIDANYIANHFITQGADYDFPYDEELCPPVTFRVFEDEFNQYVDYEIEFEDDGKLNVAYPGQWNEHEDLAGSYVEKNIPWLLLKVENKSVMKDIYNVTDD
jgi:hypothetical protein